MKIVSLFSGAGGFDLGLIQAGHDVIWANDSNADCVNTYQKNIGKHIQLGKIEDIASVDIPSADVVVGGFPCQGFSVANWERTVRDKRNKLYLEMVRVVSSLKPDFFVAENVKGLVTLGGGEVLAMIIKDFSDVGYTTFWSVLNSADYGVPQKRMRFVMLGVRHDLFEGSVFFPPEKTHYDSQWKNSTSWISVGTALSHIPEPEDAPQIPNHTYSKYKLKFNGYLGHRWIDPEKPAPTVTARGDEKGGVVVLHHPGNHRRMSVRELAIVQSFPDDFIFCGSQSSAYRQVANAVPPLLGKAIGDMLSENSAMLQQKRRLAV